MSRPFVVCHMLCSLDGRIDGSWFRLPETASALRATGQIRRDYGCDAVINGAVTCAEIYAEGYVDRLPTAGRSFERTDHLPPTQAKHTVVCVDTEGSLAWSGPTVTRRGEVSRLIEVLCESVSDDYLAYLQKKGVAYLFAGQSRLDLPLLLEKLERLGIRRLMLTGGGAMNWSFLQAGCIDELSIVLAPAVSAEPEAALFDRSRFLPGGEAKGFQLIEAKVLEDGAVWLRYQPKLLTFSFHAD